MSAPLIKCAECGKLCIEQNAVVAVCSCGSRMTEAVPTLPPWNMTERARRAEMLAERLAIALFATLGAYPPPKIRAKDGFSLNLFHATGRSALDAWTAHRADLGDLDQ